MVEHSAVNRGVVGSSPTRGALPGDCPNEVREGSLGHERKRVMCDCEAAPKLAKQGLQDLRSNEQGLTLVLSGDCPSEVKHNLMKGCVFCF